MTHRDDENLICIEDENAELMDEDVEFHEDEDAGEDVEQLDENAELLDKNVEFADEDVEKEYRSYLTLDFPDEAYNFYNRYAKYKGFSIKKSSTDKSTKSNEVIGRTFCCSSEGARNTQENTASGKKKVRANTRTGCKAMMIIRKNRNRWVVTKVELEHNHGLVSPSKIHNLRSHRKIEVAQGQVLENMNSAGVKTNRAVNFMAIEAGGSRNVGFNKRDAWNYLSTKRQKEIDKGDAAALLNYFEQQQAENPSFFYSIQVDSEDHLTNFFWADARSKIDYHHFGDVVCFDPTYLTNKYHMPFVPIIGINHHYQTILFGGALLYSETEESFVWVMDTWIRAMGGKKPGVILTDQDAAIGGAIKKVLPGTRHRYCLWHLSRNAMQNLPSNKDLHSAFNKCLWGCESVEEFELLWAKMLVDYDLSENKWLNRLYQKKELWASVYARNIFCAKMYTTQRSEGINAYFKDYLDGKMHLYVFMKHFGRAVGDRREKENDDEYITRYSDLILKLFNGIEKDAAENYTRAVFDLFQKELITGISYRHKKIKEEGSKLLYDVWREGFENSARKVTFDSSNMTVECSCRLFEFVGYQCRHVLKIFVVEDVPKIPTDYVLKRWRKDAKSGPVIDARGEHVEEDPCETTTVRYTKLCQEAISFAAKGAVSNNVYKVAVRSMHTALKAVEDAIQEEAISKVPIKKADKAVCVEEGIEVGVPEHNEVDDICAEKGKRVLDPIVKKRKGRTKRLKSFLENTPKNAKSKGTKEKATTTKRTKMKPAEPTNTRTQSNAATSFKTPVVVMNEMSRNDDLSTIEPTGNEQQISRHLVIRVTNHESSYNLANGLPTASHYYNSVGSEVLPLPSLSQGSQNIYNMGFYATSNACSQWNYVNEPTLGFFQDSFGNHSTGYSLSNATTSEKSALLGSSMLQSHHLQSLVRPMDNTFEQCNPNTQSCYQTRVEPSHTHAWSSSTSNCVLPPNYQV